MKSAVVFKKHAYIGLHLCTVKCSIRFKCQASLQQQAQKLHVAHNHYVDMQLFVQNYRVVMYTDVAMQGICILSKDGHIHFIYVI